MKKGYALPRKPGKNYRFKCQLVRIYHDDEHLAGYFIGQIPSANRLTTDIWDMRRRAPTAETKVFKRSVRNYLSLYAHLLPQFRFYELDIAVWIPLYFNAGAIITRDVSNFIKISEDGVCQALMLDDKLNLDVSIHKRNLKKGEQAHWVFVLKGRKEENYHDECNHSKALSFKAQVHGQGVGQVVQEVSSRGGKAGKGRKARG